MAVSAVAAAGVVFAAVVAVRAVAGGAGDSGTMPSATAVAQRDRVAQAHSSPAAPPSPAGSSTAAGGARGGTGDGSGDGGTAPGSGGDGNGGGDRGAGSGAAALPSTPPPGAPTISSYVRVTEVRLSGASNGDYEHQRETAAFTLAPRFALEATGVRTSMRSGRVTTVTQKVIVKGDVLYGYDGEEWTRSTLTSAQLTRLRTGSDPRQFTYLLRELPGMTRTGPDGGGVTRYLARAVLDDLYVLLPREVAAHLRKLMPAGTGIALDLRADRADRPSRIGVTTSVPGARFTGSMGFRSYR
ncbi:hypothetical protein ACQP1W_05300 [Spirillospora sp. CA-255316]